MNKFEFKNLTPFKWFVLENFPFIEADFDALTEWQLFCKLGKEMNKIINSENTVGTQMENVTNAFIELQNYVTNYFDNLDVQDEINNKLNEMVESGELQQILENILKHKIIFENVSSINWDNITSGDVVHLSYMYIKNDINGIDFLATNVQMLSCDLTNGKIFLTPLNNLDNPVTWGARIDGNTISNIPIQNCISYNKGKKIKFTTGIYAINETIEISNDEMLSIDFNESIIKSIPILDKVIHVGSKYNNNYTRSTPSLYIIENLKVDGNKSNIAIHFDYSIGNKTYKNVIFKNSHLYNCMVGIAMGDYETDNLTPQDMNIENIQIDCIGSNVYETYGIRSFSTDNYFTNIRINSARVCIYESGGSNYFNNVHGLWRQNSDATDNSSYISSQFFFQNIASQDTLFNCYCDTINTFVRSTAENDIRLTINECRYYNYLGLGCILFNFTNSGTALENNPELIIQNCTFHFPSAQNTTRECIGIYCTSSNIGLQNVKISNNVIVNKTALKDINDLLTIERVGYQNGITMPNRKLPTDRYSYVCSYPINANYPRQIVLTLAVHNTLFIFRINGAAIQLIGKIGEGTHNFGIRSYKSTNGQEFQEIYIKPSYEIAENNPIQCSLIGQNSPFMNGQSNLYMPRNLTEYTNESAFNHVYTY